MRFNYFIIDFINRHLIKILLKELLGDCSLFIKFSMRINTIENDGLSTYWISMTDTLCKKWYLSGNLWEVQKIKNNEIIHFKILNYNGKVLTESNTKKYIKAWYANGVLERYVKFKNGPSIYWYPNGVMKIEMNFKNCKEHGTSRSWYINGLLHEKIDFKNGVLHGNSLKWNQKGKLLYKRKYIGGKKIKVPRIMN